MMLKKLLIAVTMGCFVQSVSAQSPVVSKVQSSKVTGSTIAAPKGTTATKVTNKKDVKVSDVAPRGLVASYSFNNGDATDEVGVSNGTIFGATFVEDRNGVPNSALFFDGVDDYVDLGDVGMPMGTEMHDSLTIALWVKVDPTSAPGGIFTRRIDEYESYNSLYYHPNYAGYNPNQYTLDTATPSDPNFVWQADGPFYFAAFKAMQAPTFEQWQYLVVSKLGNKTVMYVDGVRADSSIDNYDYSFEGEFTGFGNAILGIAPAWNNEFRQLAFRGYIDDVKIYNGALTDEEVEEKFQEENVPTPPSSWISLITVVQDEFSAMAEFGMFEGASDGLDPALDAPEPPQAAGYSVRAWFAHPEWEGILGDNYLGDIRQLKDLTSSEEVWYLNVYTTIEGSGTITIERPVELEYPIIVRYESMMWVSTDENIEIPFTSDGESVMVYEIMVAGDITPPELEVSANMEGPAIWDNSIPRTLSWTASDINLVSVVVEFTSDYGSSWEVISDDVEINSVELDIAEIETEYAGFRVTATDASGNETVFLTTNPISIVPNGFEVFYGAGWNLRGIPFLNVDLENSTLAPNAFFFDWTGFNYAPKAFIDGADGYWLGSYSEGTEMIYGEVAETNVAMKAYMGWSMVGSPLLRIVDVDSIKVTDLSSDIVYSFADALEAELITQPYDYYSEEGYIVSEFFFPFTGYWIGIATDSVEFEFPIHNFPMVGKSVINNLNIASISMEDGKLQSDISFGTGVSLNVPTPPPAPNSNRIGMLGAQTILGDTYFSLKVDSESRIEIPLTTTGDARLIQLSWSAQTFDDNMTYQLIGSNGEVFNLDEAGDYTWNTADTNVPMLIAKPMETSNEDVISGLPNEINISQNYPNPFNPSTSIRFQLPESGAVSISVFNLLGQKVATLVNGVKSAGYHTVDFDASALSSGMYIYRLDANGTSITKKMMLLK